MSCIEGMEIKWIFSNYKMKPMLNKEIMSFCGKYRLTNSKLDRTCRNLLKGIYLNSCIFKFVFFDFDVTCNYETKLLFGLYFSTILVLRL